MAFLGPNELSVILIERYPYYRGVRKERLDCTVHAEKFFYVIPEFYRFLHRGRAKFSLAK